MVGGYAGRYRPWPYWLRWALGGLTRGPRYICAGGWEASIAKCLVGLLSEAVPLPQPRRRGGEQ